MKLHWRTLIVQRAEGEVKSAVTAILEKHSLTLVEMIGILARELESLTRYVIRGERHPGDPTKKGDEA